ncbi:hypothetical protein [Massilia timonae]|uniref:Transposase DDE domain-containing protein n=1 Tax=Massilia timonae CCUG 45783 TaxID=883126 RepID=K9DHA2_9BURK|nr:hypothetical protein [Massilia timonae]EKU84134.1 hypothetical protein HMPREF9710_00777 [Massilia timonae CCUG 45783]
MGAANFLTKGLERVKAEMSLYVLVYNFSRLLRLLGTTSMMAAIRVYARFLRRFNSHWTLRLLTRPKTARANYRVPVRFLAFQN